MEKENTLIWKSQLQIQFFVFDNINSFKSPLTDRTANIKKLRETCPFYHRIKPRVCLNQNYDMSFKSSSFCVFHSAPYTKQKYYIWWLNKLESKKAKVWKKQCLFDLIQLFRVSPMYTTILGKLDKHLPTLLDVASITGIRPTIDIFYPT